MAEPKKRTNKSKRNMRRMHDKKTLSDVLFCPECNQPIKRHHLCLNCGMYKSKSIIKTDDPKIVLNDEKDTK